jgi:hypothetical protein
MKNDLLKNVRAIRDQIGSECGYDSKRLGALVRREEVKVGKRLVASPKSKARRIHSPGAVKASV